MKTLQRTVPPVTPLPNNGAARPPHFVFDYPLKNDYGRVHLLSDLAPTLNSGKFLSSGSIYSALLKKISEPLTDGTAGQILATDGNGNRYWKDDSGMTSVTWESILNKPASFPPSSHKSSHATGAADAITPADIGAAAASHTHVQSEVTGLVNALNSKASASALSSHTGNTSNPHSVTKSQIGLGNVDNTSDMAKPVSTAASNAIMVKADAETGSAQEAVITLKNDGSVPELVVRVVDKNRFSIEFLEGCYRNNVSIAGSVKTRAELEQMSRHEYGVYEFDYDFGSERGSRMLTISDDQGFLELRTALGTPGAYIRCGVEQDGNSIVVDMLSGSYTRTDRTVTLYKSVPESISSHDSSASAHSTQFASKITNPSGGNVGDVLSKTASGTSWIAPPGGTDTNAVHYTGDDGKSTEQKTQARTNIGAASSSDLTSHTGNTSNPHSVTKSQIGLGNVDNTSDMTKPISTAVASALSGKQAAKLYKWDIPQGHGITYTTGYSNRLPEEYVELDLSPFLYNPDVGGAGRVTKENGTYYWSPNLFRLESYPVQAGVETIVLEEALSGKYTKPSGGIPSTDMTSAVQTSLGKADTALQTHQDISGKLDKSGGTMTGSLYTSDVYIGDGGSPRTLTFLFGDTDVARIMAGSTDGQLEFLKGSVRSTSVLIVDGTPILTKALGDGYYSGKSDIKYGYNALTPSGSPLAANAVDGSINILPASVSGDAFTINLPYPTSGKVTDVIVRLDCSNLESGATLPAITWACKNAGGTAQTITWRDISGDTVEVGKVYWYCITLYPTGATGDNTMDGMMAIRELKART